MDNAIFDRFRAVRMHLGLSQPDMSAKLGLSKNCWQTYELGKSLPGTSIYQSLRDLGFSANWILFGEGGMLSSGGKSCDYKSLPKYSFLPQPGRCGCLAESVGSLCFSDEFLRVELKSSPENLALLVSEGDAMVPTINPGDLLIVDTTKRSLNGDGLYVLNLFGGCLVKRVQSLVNGTVKIISDNPAYEVQVIDGSDFDHLYVAARVVWHGRRT